MLEQVRILGTTVKDLQKNQLKEGEKQEIRKQVQLIKNFTPEIELYTRTFNKNFYDLKLRLEQLEKRIKAIEGVEAADTLASMRRKQEGQQKEKQKGKRSRTEVIL